MTTEFQRLSQASLLEHIDTVGAVKFTIRNIVCTGTRNIALSRNAIVLATRLPELPDGGDLALDRETITDPRTGLSMELAMYPGFRMATYHISVCWGVTVFKPEHVGVIVG